MSGAPPPPQIAWLGLEPLSYELVRKAVQGQPILKWEYDLDKLLAAPIEAHIRIILCGPPPKGTSLLEVAQFLRMQYPSAAIYYLTTERTGFARRDYITNGFTDALLIPIDSPTFVQLLAEQLARELPGKAQAYRSVKLVDVQPGQAMDFDTFLYMPANRKHIRFSVKGDPIDRERTDRLATHKVSSLQIQARDLQKFYHFTAQQLKNLGESETIGATEKRDRMQRAVRELINDLFQDSSSDASFDKGKAVVKDCQEIVKAYIMSSVNGADNAWYERLLALSQTENTAYTHSANLATFSAMFALALGIGNPEQLAMAGLLHDVGLSEVPASVLSKQESERTPEEHAAYQKHPMVSVTLIQKRKMIIPEVVLKIVAQHHERYDGKGYPNGVRGEKIRPEAQLLALADEFCYLTAGTAETVALKPLDAIKKIHDEIPTGEDGHKYDPALVRRIYELFRPAHPSEES